MGQDKSSLEIGGQALWKHQLRTLQATHPNRLFISSSSDGLYPDCGAEILRDEFPDIGPLGGIATALRHFTSPFLLVLAIDMPAMTAAFLRTLIDSSLREGRGIVPFSTHDVKTARSSTHSLTEPLAALYPRAALEVANDCIRKGIHKMETLIGMLKAENLVVLNPLRSIDIPLFANWNTPEDLPQSPVL